MRLFFAFLCSFCVGLEASDLSRSLYVELIQKYPHLVEPLGDHTKGEIEIILDPARMEAVEKSMGRDVGVIARDRFWIWINDACIFPSGKEGIYARQMWVKALEGTPGVAVMPILPNGKVVLNCNFRHATRSWEIELPRGVINPGEDPHSAAKRETVEETGMVVDSLVQLGLMPPDSGLTTSIVPIFLAKVVTQQETEQEETEAIEEILALSLDEIKKAFVQGYYEMDLRGEKKKVPFRDPFLSYAILLGSLQP